MDLYPAMFNKFILIFYFLFRLIPMRDKTRYYEDHKYACDSPSIPIMEPVHVLLYHIKQRIWRKQQFEKKATKKRSQKNKQKNMHAPQINGSNNMKENKMDLDPNFHRIQKKFVRSINVNNYDHLSTTTVRIQNGRIIKLNGENLKCIDEPLLSSREISELFDDRLFGSPVLHEMTFQ